MFEIRESLRRKISKCEILERLFTRDYPNYRINYSCNKMLILLFIIWSLLNIILSDSNPVELCHYYGIVGRVKFDKKPSSQKFIPAKLHILADSLKLIITIFAFFQITKVPSCESFFPSSNNQLHNYSLIASNFSTDLAAYITY